MTQRFKIKLAAIAKDEGFYLPLWVYHHLHVGFDVIDIRINDTTDNSLKILEKLKVIYGGRLCFSVADQELQTCIENNNSFQSYIYTKIYQETLKEDFTHLVFLDIDEYWCAANLTAGIKDFLNQTIDFDVCMFQWFMDVADQQCKLDDFSFKTSIKGQKNGHVKSLLNLKAKVEQVRIHNYELSTGIYLLAEGTAISFAENDHSRGLLPKDIVEEARLTLSTYFVYHQTLRSQEEYLAGLLRGNKQIGDNSLLKTNRFGYVNLHSDAYTLIWSVDEAVLADYTQGYQALALRLQDDLLEAKNFVLTRKNEVLRYLNDSVFLQKLHESRMRGIDQAIYRKKENKYLIKVKISKLNYNQQSLVCSFDCEIMSDYFTYELVITQAFSSTPVAATISLLGEEQYSQRIARHFRVSIHLQDLSHVVYVKWPPFCLAATIDNELILLERSYFQDLGKLIAPKAAELRQVNQSTMPTPLKVTQGGSVTRQGFWKKLLGKH